MRRIPAILLVAFGATAGAETGTLLVPSLVGNAPPPGWEAPRLWIYDLQNVPVPSTPETGYALDERITLESGPYLLELGLVRAVANRSRVDVVAGQITVVPIGLVAIEVEPEEAQPPDTCRQWSAALEVALRPTTGVGALVAAATASAHPTETVLAFLPGYYRVTWNGFGIDVAVRPNTRYTVETGYFGPAPAPDYELADREGAAQRQRLCARRPTRVLARAYAGTFNEPISEPPFRARVWQRVIVPPTAAKVPPFQPLKPTKIPGTNVIYATTLPLWEQEPEAPLEDKPPEAQPAPDPRPEPALDPRRVPLSANPAVGG